MKLPKQDVDYIYKSTKKESKSLTWHEVQAGRLTASVAHAVLHTNMENPSRSHLMKICNPTFSGVSAPSIIWGKTNEKRTIEEYTLQISFDHDDFCIDECFLKLCMDESYIGATPDGIFFCQCHAIANLIEVKCPYSLKDIKSIDEVDQSAFFITSDNELKTNHQYYAQIQLQLYAFETEICHLIVWTPNWNTVINVEKDTMFIESMLAFFRQFYLKSVSPELSTRKIENERHAAPSNSSSLSQMLYCFCQSVDDGTGSWIGCDAADYKYEWFNQKCVNIKRPPKGDWYCTECRKKKRKEQ